MHAFGPQPTHMPTSLGTFAPRTGRTPRPSAGRAPADAGPDHGPYGPSTITRDASEATVTSMVEAERVQAITFSAWSLSSIA